MNYFFKLVFALIIIFNINTASVYGKDVMPLIPKDVFNTRNIISEPCKRLKGHQKFFKIFWYEREIDGSFYLVVHPRQIFLKTGFNNPNPKRLYWLTHIDEKQYNDIVAYLTNEKHKHLKKQEKVVNPGYILYEFQTPIKELPKENLLHHYIRIFTNINLLIWDLNNNLKRRTKSIEPPDPFFIFRMESALISDH